jgi:hypothetical protein
MMSWCWCCERANENIIFSLWTAVNKNNKNNNNNNHRHRTSARARARHAGRRANILSQQKRSRRQNLAELFFFCMARVETCWTSSNPITRPFILGGPRHERSTDAWHPPSPHDPILKCISQLRDGRVDTHSGPSIRPQPTRESPQFS